MKNSDKNNNARTDSENPLIENGIFDETDPQPEEDARFKSPDDLLNQLAPKRAKVVAEELAALKERYHKEIEKWREYERMVIEWKKQVMEIVSNLQNELAQKQELEQEVKRLKSQVEPKKSKSSPAISAPLSSTEEFLKKNFR